MKVRKEGIAPKVPEMPAEIPTLRPTDASAGVKTEVKGNNYVSHDPRKPVFGTSDQVQHKPVCTVPEKQGCHGQGKSLENEIFSRSGKSQGIWV